MARSYLAFDTSAAHCAAAFVQDGAVVLARSEPMQRGQAERLMPFLQEVLAEAGAGWGDLAGLAVGIGPGNFTGVRIAVAAARGLALGLGVPAIGISSFELMLDPQAGDDLLITIPAPRDQIYAQRFRAGAASGAPWLIDLAEVPADLAAAAPVVVRGHRAGELADMLGARAEEVAIDDHANALGRRAAWRFGQPLDGARPAPLYVRPPDAAPPSDPPPVILDA